MMADVDAHEIRFQCPNFGHDLTQTIGRLKAQERMTCRIVASESISTPIESQEPPKKSEGDRRKPVRDLDQVFPLAVLAFSHASDLRDIHSVISAPD
jgi:hypothetical protein